MKHKLTIIAILIYALSSCALHTTDNGPLTIYDYDSYGSFINRQYSSNPLDISRSLLELDEYLGLSETDKAQDTTFNLLLEMGNGIYKYQYISKGSKVYCTVDTKNSRLGTDIAWSCQASVTPINYSLYSLDYVSKFSYDGSTCFLIGENEKFEARFISEDPRGLQRWSVKIEGTDFSKTKEDLIATFASDGYINITEYFDEERIVNKASEGSITYKVYNKGNLIKKYTYKLIP